MPIQKGLNDMKKYRIKSKFRFTVFMTTCVLVCVFVFGSMLGFFNAQAAQPADYMSYKVQSGDTLWNIARTYGPADQDVRATVSQICALNSVSAQTLRPGQIIQVPQGK